VATGNQQVIMTTRGQQDDGIKRVVPRVNESVNGHWICDEGRLSYERLEAAARLSTAQDSAHQQLDWDAAVKRMADALGTAARAGKAAAILSPRLTSETLFAWKRLFDALGGVKVGVRRLARGADDELLIRADRGANSTGAAWIFGEAADEASVLDAVGRGEIHTLLIAGDSLDPDDTVVLDDAQRARLEHVLYAGPFLDAAARQATLLLPTAAWAEEDGTLVNFEGRIQRVRRARVPRGEGRPGWRVVADVAHAADLEWPTWTDAEEVLATLADGVAPYDGTTVEQIGLLGVARGASAVGA
jgi:NADH-quinone oxidoreductase subunit G